MVAMTLHKELANQGTRKHHDEQNKPALWMRVQETVMVAEHGKNHRQREIGVVHTALLAALAVNGQGHGVVLFARSHGRHHFALARNDPNKHIGTHGRGNHGAHQQKGGPARKQLTGQP